MYLSSLFPLPARLLKGCACGRASAFGLFLGDEVPRWAFLKVTVLAVRWKKEAIEAADEAVSSMQVYTTFRNFPVFCSNFAQLRCNYYYYFHFLKQLLQSGNIELIFFGSQQPMHGGTEVLHVVLLTSFRLH